MITALTSGRLFRVMMLALCFIAFSACESNEPGEMDDVEAVDPGADTDLLDQQNTGMITVDDINDNTDQYIGQTVTVSGELESHQGGSAFTLDGDGIVGDEILVILPQGTSILMNGATIMLENLDDDATIEVTGTVARYIEAELESQFGLDLTNEEIEFEEQKPAIIASSVTVRAATEDEMEEATDM